MMRAFMVIVMLAWRNLWRNHRRTIVMLAAISVGVWAMIFMTALTRGMVSDMVRDGLQTLPGQVQAHNPQYRDDPSISNLLSMSGAEIDASFADADFAGWAARVRVPAIISSERESRGVTLLGIDPLQEASISAIGSNVSEGRNLENADDNGVVIGRKLAEKLDTEIGKRIVLMSQDPANEIADRGFRVVGLFKANLESNEEAFVLVGKNAAQKMLRIGDQVSEVAVVGNDYRDRCLVAVRRQRETGRCKRGDPEPW